MSDGELDGEESDKEIILDVEFLTDNDDDELQEARHNVKHFRRKLRKEDIEGEINVDVVESVGDVNAVDIGVYKDATCSESESFKVAGYESEYIESENDASFCTGDEDSDEGVDGTVRRKSKYIRFDPEVVVPQWEVGQLFRSLKEFKQAAIKYAISTGKNVNWIKNEPTRCRVACVPGCRFVLLCSWCSTANAFRLKTYNPEHSCTRSNKIKVVNQDFLVEYFKETIKDNPRTKVREIKRLCKKVLKIDVNISKCRRIKNVVIKELEGNYLEQYSKLYDYAEELKRSNTGTTVVVDTYKERNPKVEFFQRFYVCFKCCKSNWIAGCRPVIGLDGCFLKGLCKGQLLCAVGRDANNQMFPIAWAVVRVENNQNWGWFYKLLAADIEYDERKLLTFISDMQKGILNAVQEVFPSAEHRLCARHVFAAWQKKNRGEDFRLFWMATKSTYEQQLEDRLKEIDSLSTGSTKALCNKYPVEKWCKAYFKTFSKCDVVDNNLSETFNGWIMDARSKSIIHMLEDIRVMVMRRLQVKRDWMKKWTQQYAPRAMMKMEKNKEVAIGCEVVWNGDGGFEVVDGDDKHVVHKDKCSCTCRSWDLTGIPCAHAVSTIWHMGEEPLNYMSDWYHKDTYLKTYQLMMQPVRDTK